MTYLRAESMHVENVAHLRGNPVDRRRPTIKADLTRITSSDDNPSFLTLLHVMDAKPAPENQALSALLSVDQKVGAWEALVGFRVVQGLSIGAVT